MARKPSTDQQISSVKNAQKIYLVLQRQIAYRAWRKCAYSQDIHPVDIEKLFGAGQLYE